MGIKEVAAGDSLGSESVRDRIRAERVAQGFPPTLSSPASLAMIAAAVRATIAERAA
jgi:hypothetical protein